MSGIIGAVHGESVVPHLMAGLRHMRHRDTDSAAIAVARNRQVELRRSLGPLARLETALRRQPLDGANGIAHTRRPLWRRDPPGSGNPANRQPEVAVVCSGPVANLPALRDELASEGHPVTELGCNEVIARLIAHYVASGAARDDAVRRAIGRIQGDYALGILFGDDSDHLLAAQRGVPLLLGTSELGTVLSSDEPALARLSDSTIPLEHGDWAILSRDRIEIRDRRDRLVQRQARRAEPQGSGSNKSGYRHFMLKEIHEQPEAIRRTLLQCHDAETGRFRTPGRPIDFGELTHLTLVGSGTAHYAGLIARRWFESLAGLPVTVETASEYRDHDLPGRPGSGALFISRSGETADTLAALQRARRHGLTVTALVDNPDSALARAADQTLRTAAGREIGVATTKAFTTQLARLAALAIEAARQRDWISDDEELRLSHALVALPLQAEKVLSHNGEHEQLARRLAGTTTALVVGHGTAYPIALEGALKLKQVAYMHAEGYYAGELKHGPMALLDSDPLVVILAPRGRHFERTIDSMHEVASRGGRVLLVGDEATIATYGHEAVETLVMPRCLPLLQPILYALPMQLLAYHLATRKGHHIDRPRHLAGVVTS